MSHPIIISVAPNGARKTKKELPHIPITAEEVVKEANDCITAGVSLFHLHVRNDDESHSLDPERYKKSLSQLKEAYTDQLIWQISTETCGIFTPNEQHHLIHTIKPEAVSIGVREFIPDPTYETSAQKTLDTCLENKTLIQYICYSQKTSNTSTNSHKSTSFPTPKPIAFFLYSAKKQAKRQKYQNWHPS